jgi:hypothetical protein
MFRTVGLKGLVGAVAAAVVVALAQGSALAAGFSAPLLVCANVTMPAPITGCASTANNNDPLTSGSVSIDNVGDVTIDIDGALPNQEYVATLVPADGSAAGAATPLAIGTVMTGPKGNGSLRKNLFFKFGAAGAGTVVVNFGPPSGSNTPGPIAFVSGLAVSTDQLSHGSDLNQGMDQCGEVSVPGALTSLKCGTDGKPQTNSNGSVNIENDDGTITIRLNNAAPNSNYSAELLALSGASIQLGTLKNTKGGATSTDKHGNGAFLVNGTTLIAGENISGTIVLQNISLTPAVNEFVSGFKVSAKPSSPDVSQAALVPCAGVTNPDPTNCGGESLEHPSLYEVDQNGKLTVVLTGAGKGSENYEAWFRPLDNSGDVDLGVEIDTNSSGNATKVQAGVFPAGSIYSGSVVIKLKVPPNSPNPPPVEPDEFVPGFEIK